jgi:hypothetical protein
MHMLERYLHAIEFWLPSDQRQDILAEISEDLNSQIEDQQSALGRTLTDAELEALLKRRGRPVLVANRYRPQQSLIGPVWFPAYIFVLKIVGFCYVLPWLIVSVVVHRVQHPALSWGTSLVAAWGTAWTVAFVAAGVVTLIFTFLQLAETQTHFLENWNPRRLPLLRDPYKIPISTSIAELVSNVVFLLWWMTYVSSPFLFDGPAFKLSLAPIQVFFFWGFLVIALFNIALSIANLRSRHWNSLRATCRLVLDFAGSALFCWLMKTNLVATLYIAHLDPARTLALKQAIHIWMNRCFPIAVIISTIVVMIDLTRIVRVHRRDSLVLTRVLALMACLVATGASSSINPAPGRSFMVARPPVRSLQTQGEATWLKESPRT